MDDIAKTRRIPIKDRVITFKSLRQRGTGGRIYVGDVEVEDESIHRVGDMLKNGGTIFFLLRKEPGPLFTTFYIMADSVKTTVKFTGGIGPYTFWNVGLNYVD